MNKLKKILAVIIALIVVISTFSVTAFAEENYNIIDTDCFYAVVPDDYYPSYDGSGENIVFQDDDYNTIRIGKKENSVSGFENGISKASEDNFKKFVGDFYEMSDDIEVEFLKSSKGKVNGLSYYITNGKYLDWFLSDNKEKAYYYDFCVCLFATKEYIYVICFEEYCDEYSEIAEFEDAGEFLNTVAINGTYFDGEKLEKPHQFSDKTFESAIEETGNIINDNDVSLIKGFVIIVFVLPIVILLVIAIILIVKNRKRKKLIEKYEMKYGMLGGYNTNNYNPNGYNQPQYNQSNNPNNYNGYNYGTENPQQMPQEASSEPIYKSSFYNSYETHSSQEAENTASQEPESNESDI